MVRTFARRSTTHVAMRWLAILAIPVCCPVRLHAETISWINGGGGIFGTVSNWSDLPNLPDRAPGPTDVARFGLTASVLAPSRRRRKRNRRQAQQRRLATKWTMPSRPCIASCRCTGPGNRGRKVL